MLVVQEGGLRAGLLQAVRGRELEWSGYDRLHSLPAGFSCPLLGTDAITTFNGRLHRTLLYGGQLGLLLGLNLLMLGGQILRGDNLVIEHVVVLLIGLRCRQSSTAAGVCPGSLGGSSSGAKLALIFTFPLRSQVAVLSESLGEGIVVNLELSDSLVLIGRHAQELCLFEGDSCLEVVAHYQLEAEQIRGGHDVYPHVIFVH